MRAHINDRKLSDGSVFTFTGRNGTPARYFFF